CDLVPQRLVELGAAAYFANGAGEGRRDRAQRGRVTPYSRRERRIRRGLFAKPGYFGQRPRYAAARGARYHHAGRRGGLFRLRGELRGERKEGARVATHAFSALPRASR